MRRPRAPRKSAAPLPSTASSGRPAAPPPRSPRPTLLHPYAPGGGGGTPEGHGPLLAALAEHPGHVALAVQVVDVEPDQLAHPDPGGVEELEHRHVAQPDRAAVVGVLGCRAHQFGRLVGAQHRRQRAVRLGGAQARAGVEGGPAGARQPGGEDASRGRAARERGPGAAHALLLGQPAAQGAQVELAGLGPTEPRRVVQEPGHVTDVGPHRVRGQVALGAEVALVVAERPGHRLGQLRRPLVLAHVPSLGRGRPTTREPARRAANHRRGLVRPGPARRARRAPCGHRRRRARRCGRSRSRARPGPPEPRRAPAAGGW